MQFYLSNYIRPKSHHRKWRKLPGYASKLPVNMTTVPNFLDFTINAVLHPTFIRKLYYKLSSILHLCDLYIHTDFWSKFCLLYWMASTLPRLLDTASKFALFSVSGFKDEKFIKKANLWKLKHANSILESLEYFCQISSKLLLIIFSYTVSKLVHFWDTVYYILSISDSILTTIAAVAQPLRGHEGACTLNFWNPQDGPPLPLK